MRRKAHTPRTLERTDIGLDYGYYPGKGAHIYTSACLTGKLTTRFYVSIVIAPSWEPFEISIGGRSELLAAAVVKPLTQSGKKIVDRPLLTVHLEPTHSHFRTFSSIPTPGVLPIDRALFAEFDAELITAVRGKLPIDAAGRLIDRIVGSVTGLLPPAPPADPRVASVLDLMRCEPGISLPKIASAFNLSYDRTSHVFTEAMGLPFRSYQLWLKVRRANSLLWKGATLTAAAHGAGFADSAHLCRTYQQVFGRPPSYFFDGRFVRIFTRDPRLQQLSA